MILVDHQIRDVVKRKELEIENFDEDSIQPASYDMRIGQHIYSASELHPERRVDLSKNGGTYAISPYGSVILLTYETLQLPLQMTGRFGLTSGLTRKGLFASTGPQIDPGYKGKLFVTVFNVTPLSQIISYKQKFLSIEFHTLESVPEKPYEGPYQGKTDIGPEILEDFLRIEGFNLSQMQSQFTELAQHVKELSNLAPVFTAFLEKMDRQTDAIEKLADLLSAKAVAPVETTPVEVRRISRKRAEKEILDLFKRNDKLYYSDIAESLRLDFATVIEVCNHLKQKGLIEGETDGKARSKKSR